MEVQALKITCGSAFYKKFFNCLDFREGGKKREEERRNELQELIMMVIQSQILTKLSG